MPALKPLFIKADSTATWRAQLHETCLREHVRISSIDSSTSFFRFLNFFRFFAGVRRVCFALLSECARLKFSRLEPARLKFTREKSPPGDDQVTYA